ncbi:MAG: hypothetical protein KKA67_02770 [Spirochaetes bacterium]|nr:hypothetical protein [Spirochaetota bacterium]MBU1081776.1 hypothetical protein [Spirochaetota bacterium]
MKRLFFSTALALALVSAAAAQGAPIGDATFVGRIDLGIGIARLAEIARTGDSEALAEISGDAALLLFGTLSGAVVKSEEPFEAVVEFLEGEWKGSSEIVLHRVFLVFRGEAYREFLDGSSGRRTVVIARDATLRANKAGTNDVYMNVVSVRPIF